MHRIDRWRGQLWLRRQFSAILIGGEDWCGFDDELAQFWSAARTMAVSTTIQRNFDPRQGPPISSGNIFILMYSIDSIYYSPYLLICICISLDQWWGDWVSEWIIICILLVYARISILQRSPSPNNNPRMSSGTVGRGDLSPIYILNIMLTSLPLPKQ